MKTFRKVARAIRRARKEPKKEYRFLVFEEMDDGMQEQLMETAVRPDKEQTDYVAHLMAAKGSDAVMEYFLGLVLRANPKLKGKKVRLVKTD
jgi:hypothetical protein